MKQKDYIILTGLKVSCIIGIFDWERKQRQDVLIDLKLTCDIHRASLRDKIEDTINYKIIAKSIITFVEKSEYKLIETLAEKLATYLIHNFNLEELHLSLSKPGAVRGSKNIGVEIHRINPETKKQNLIYLSLGSNINSWSNIQFALSEINKKFTILGQSHVYETSPVGYTRQKPFWNLIVVIGTNESINNIRKWSVNLEKTAGRIHTRNPLGPRSLDIDLILFGNQIKKSGNYTLPHPDIVKKAFVLFPLVEINPNLVHPLHKITMIELASKFKDSAQKIRQLVSTTFPEFQPLRLND